MYKLFFSAFLFGFLLFSEVDAYVANPNIFVNDDYYGIKWTTVTDQTGNNSIFMLWYGQTTTNVNAFYNYAKSINKAPDLTGFTYLVNWNWDIYPSLNWNTLGNLISASGSIYLNPYGNSYDFPLKIRWDKLYIENQGFCMYKNSSDVNFKNFVVFPWFNGTPCTNLTYSLPWVTGTNWEVYTIYLWTSPPPEPWQPNWNGTLSTTINGLNCSTKLAPDIDNANWYYPWRYTNFVDQSSTWSLRLIFRQDPLNSDNVDIVEYSLINDWWSEIPYNAINWTNTGANAFLIGNWELKIQGIDNRNFRSFNLLQIWGVLLPTGTTLPIRYESLNGSTHNWISIMSGSTLTIWFNELVKKVWISNIGRFSGIRLWIATEKSVTFCGVANASCGYKFIGTGLECTPLRVYTTLSQGSCVVAGSGSLYGSGSCVPAVNASGAIIPFVESQNVTIQYDQNGNITGSYINPLPNNTYFDNVFSCGFLEEDSWYVTIGKSLICPITVTKNIVLNAWDNVNDAVDGLQPLQNSITNLDTVTGSTISTGATTSGFTDAFSDRLDSIGKGNTFLDKMFNFVWYGMILTVIIFIIGILIFLIRKNK